MIETISVGVIGAVCVAAMLYILYGFTKDSIGFSQRNRHSSDGWHRRGF
jgi:hypothetical protein